MILICFDSTIVFCLFVLVLVLFFSLAIHSMYFFIDVPPISEYCFYAFLVCVSDIFFMFSPLSVSHCVLLYTLCLYVCFTQLLQLVYLYVHFLNATLPWWYILKCYMCLFIPSFIWREREGGERESA